MNAIKKSSANIIPAEFSDFSAVATFAIDPDHRVLYWNKACEELTGKKSSEVVGTSRHWQPFYDNKRPCLSDIVISGKYEEIPELYKTYGKSRLIKNGIHAEGWYENLGGKKRYIMFDAAPVYNEHGLLVGAVETLLDITDKKKEDTEREQLIKNLQKNLGANKTLHGFIPICASCRKIRDKEGNWISLEEYIIKHTEYDFSHGVCDKCAKKLYPQFFKNKPD